jgi:hypothetical protein
MTTLQPADLEVGMGKNIVTGQLSRIAPEVFGVDDGVPRETLENLALEITGVNLEVSLLPVVSVVLRGTVLHHIIL